MIEASFVLVDTARCKVISLSFVKQNRSKHMIVDLKKKLFHSVHVGNCLINYSIS